jgi:hypothetical protein
MIARRMLEMPPPVIVTLADHGKKVWRKTNYCFNTPPMTSAEIDVWKIAHERGQSARCDARELPEGIDDVRAWPIHETDWRREFVRTAVTEPW